MKVVGIDPGISGAYCILLEEERPYIFSTPLVEGDFDAECLATVARSNFDDIDLVVIEEQHAFPGYGPRCSRCHKPKFQEAPQRVFKSGYGYGLWVGVLAALKISFKAVTAQEWKGPLGLSSDKKKSITKAQDLFPGVNLLRTPRCRVPDHNFAEALLLAVHARKIIRREE